MGTEGWAARIGAAFTIAMLVGFIVWAGGALVTWLSQFQPIWIMFAIAGVLFPLLIIGDWFVDWFNTRDARNSYEAARRAAMARSDDEL